MEGRGRIEKEKAASFSSRTLDASSPPSCETPEGSKGGKKEGEEASLAKQTWPVEDGREGRMVIRTSIHLRIRSTLLCMDERS